VNILEQEVSEGDYALLDTIMRRHVASAPAHAFSEATQADCERLVTRGILVRKECEEPLGLHYLVPPQVIGAYLRQEGKCT
jgi:hypothetical protein